MSETNKIDWAGLAERNIDKAITVLLNKVQGIKTPVGAGVSLSGSGVSVWSSARILPFLLIGTAIIGVTLILKGK